MFNLKKYSVKNKIALVTNQPQKETIENINISNEQLSAKDFQIIEREIQEAESIPSSDLVQKFLSSPYPISQKTLRIIYKLFKEIEDSFSSETAPNVMAFFSNEYREIEQKLLERGDGTSDWELEILMRHPPSDINEIINPILRQRYYEYLYNKNKNVWHKTVEKPITETQKSPELEMEEMRRKLREEMSREDENK